MRTAAKGMPDFGRHSGSRLVSDGNGLKEPGLGLRLPSFDGDEFHTED